MSASGKIASLAVLTFFLLGFSELIQKGSFIVPFPLIPEFFLGMTLAMSFNEIVLQKSNFVPFILLLISALLGEFTSQLFLETCFPLESIVEFYDSGIIDVLKIGQIVALFIALTVFTFGFSNKTIQGILIVLALCIFPVHLMNEQIISNQLRIYGWFVCIGIFAFAIRKYKINTKIGMQSIANLLFATGIIHLLSIISLVVNG